MQITIPKKAVFIALVLVLALAIAFMASKIFTQTRTQSDLSNSAPAANTPLTTVQSSSDPYANGSGTSSSGSNSVYVDNPVTNPATPNSNSGAAPVEGSSYGGSAATGVDNTGGMYSNATGGQGTVTGVGAVDGDNDEDND
jgi:predicted lipid-binding transport protein (Tim44 family)